MYVLGVDLGQQQDYTAIVKLKKRDRNGKGKDPIYHIFDAERLPLGIPYPAQVRKVGQIMSKLPGCNLAVDATGVGQAPVDMFREAGLQPTAIYIHGGDSATQSGPDIWRVPKRDLTGVVQVLLQNKQLQMADGLKWGPTLLDELLNFRVKIDPITSHDSYSAWREGQHDDLVLSVALACWQALVVGAREILDFTKFEVPIGRGYDEIGDCDGFKPGRQYF